MFLKKDKCYRRKLSKVFVFQPYRLAASGSFIGKLEPSNPFVPMLSVKYTNCILKHLSFIQNFFRERDHLCRLHFA